MAAEQRRTISVTDDNVRSRPLSDFPRTARAHLDVARRLSNPVLMGPPICDELVAFVEHLFTEDEARLVRHLGTILGKTASDVARIEGLPTADAEPLLRRLADETRAIAASGSGPARSYRLLPILPGIFEMVLIGQTPGQMTPWHHRFAQLFEQLFETGYTRAYQAGQSQPSPIARVIPVGQTIEAHPMALPSDRLELVLDRYDTFGIGPCQCRMTAQAAGKGCGRPLGNCAVMGQWAERGIADGWLKPVGRTDVLEIKREAESHGLVTWMMNVESSKGQISCSCCGCCCHALRMVTDFNAPGYIAPAHFVPRFNDATCSFCGRCVRACPTSALTVDRAGKSRTHRTERCLGCGLCAVACNRPGAVTMEPVAAYDLPYRSWYAYVFHTSAQWLKGAWNVWRHR